MKAREFATALSASAAFLGAQGPGLSRELDALTDIFANAPSATMSVAALLKKLAAADAVTDRTARGPRRDGMAQALVMLERFLTAWAKPAALKDIRAVATFLADRPGIELSSLKIKPTAKRSGSGAQRRDVLRDDMIEQYREQLQANLTNADGFAAIHRALATSDVLSRGELIALSRRFSGVAARSKDDALKKIWDRLQRFMTNQAKARATSGRSAA